MLSSPRRRLLIINHADDQRLPYLRHMIHVMIPMWEQSGIEVTQVYGTRTAPPADVAFLHVDLSVVPPAYLDLANRYPVTINGGLPDILKSRLSQLRVTPDSGYTGPVIVKSSLNYAGQPEMAYFRKLSKLQRLWYRIRHLGAPRPAYPIRLRDKSDYVIHPSPGDVPQAVWECPNLVVEKFMPERHDGLYCLREWYFCGDQEQDWVELSPDPIFTSAEQAMHLQLGIPPELRELRKRLGFDYGKFDYTMIDGKPAVFDFNKTTGIMDAKNENTLAMARKLAAGIKSYFN